MSSDPHAVLFDLDGVLLDSREAMKRAILGTATAALGSPMADDVLSPGSDRLPHYEILSRLGIHDQETVSDLSRRRRWQSPRVRPYSSPTP
ncbi:hypothetical protein AB0C81_18195 [Streptomyces roseoverticillatus]|uniref:hypothetical protein n=1 Tax=Streptomyces roseoverticillatus TaxID=66429 RepID=UPI0033C897E5